MNREIKKIEWLETCERFVAFFDIMGFKEMILREKHENVLAKMHKLKKVLEHIENVNRKGQHDAIIRTVLFSDSIILVSDSSSTASAFILTVVSRVFLYTCLFMQIPVKGVIAHGTMTCNVEKSIYLGRPLIDAYLLQQELALYGIVLHDTAEAKIQQYDERDLTEDPFFIRYPTPLGKSKSAKVNHVNINWVDKTLKIDPIIAVKKFYNTVSGYPRIYVDNTIEFVNYVQGKKTKKVRKAKRKM